MVNRSAALLAAEVAFLLVVLTGVALVHVPTALILAGVLGVLVIERKGGDGT